MKYYYCYCCYERCLIFFVEIFVLFDKRNKKQQIYSIAQLTFLQLIHIHQQLILYMFYASKVDNYHTGSFV
ncbi:unnamed protein product [Schistosoma margrebowiei]|uniref:Uncharacterized protein n=1 Tax=Schistosoma margrebowiei TaxID=48269 RepID=A0A183LV91_9TREM|nr:unnamed protein product [Schistosoma margrebowiei]